MVEERAKQGRSDRKFASKEKKHYLSKKFPRLARSSFLYEQYETEAEDDVRSVTAVS
jgi:hypothetical protein